VSRRLKRSTIGWGLGTEQVFTYGVVPAGHKWEILWYMLYGDFGPGQFAGLLVTPPGGSLAWIHLVQNQPASSSFLSSEVGGFPLLPGDTLQGYHQGSPGVAHSHAFTYIDVDFT